MLLLGHTHDLVDQFFSRISTKINTSDTCINTLQQLKKLITKSYDVTTGDVHVEFIEEVPDLAEWTSKLNMPHVVGVSVPHCFIIYSNFIIYYITLCFISQNNKLPYHVIL